jgi:hypothetical protein
MGYKLVLFCITNSFNYMILMNKHALELVNGFKTHVGALIYKYYMYYVYKVIIFFLVCSKQNKPINQFHILIIY